MRSVRRIRRSVRAFVRTPGLSLALLLTVGLGVGTNGAVYGFLQGLVQPDAGPDAGLRGAERVVSIFSERGGEAGPLSLDEYGLLKKRRGDFAWIGAVRIKPADTTMDGHAEIATVAAVTPDVARALALPLGDGVAISDRIWKSEFGGRADAIGSTIRIDGVETRIWGVAPERLEGLYSDRSVDVWKLWRAEDALGGASARRDVWVLARLSAGVSASEAESTLRAEPAGLGEVSVVSYTGVAPKMARGLERVGMFLTFTAAAVFLVACINVASFLLGRAFRRSRETSLEIALGATRAELLWELFADSVVISVAGGVLGLVLGILTAHALPAFLFEEDAERLRFAPHLLPIMAASVVCVGITALCGMLPVVGTVTDRPWTVLQREAGMPSKGIQRLRSGLVIVQVAACCMLVIGTALLLDGLHAALETGAGHRLGDPVLLTVRARTRPAVDTDYFKEVQQKAETVAGLSPLAWTAELPGSQATWRLFKVQPTAVQYRNMTMDIAWLTPESLESLEILPVAGRMFGIDDPRHRVAVVDEEAASRLFGRDTVGVVIKDSNDQPVEIIGVVKRKAGGAEERRATIFYDYVDQAKAPIREAMFHVPLAAPHAEIELNANVVSAEYFSALDMSVIAGRTFRGDSMAGREGVINQEAADLYFDGKPVGAETLNDRGVRTEIIGVVRSQVFGTFEQRAEPTIYFPMGPDCPPQMTLMLHDAKWDSGIEGELRRTIGNVPGRGAGAIGITTLHAQLARSGLAALRIATLIGSASAMTALILSFLGLLSAQSDAEYQRQRDRALRIALGAQRWRIVGMVVMHAGRLALVGTLVGTALSFALLRVLVAGITGVTSPGYLVWLIAPLVSVVAVTLASAVPARRASAVSPLTALRDS